MADLKNSIKLNVHDIISGNDVVRNVPDRSGYVTSSSELSKYVNEDPGFIAIQYGFKHMWQLKPNRSWEQVF